ncbi:MAG: hypothetical protein ACR2J4_06970 [Deinococcus sp.]
MSAVDDPVPSWQQLLNECAGQAVAALAQVPGLVGLVLAGSLGRGEPWPLSDIDLIPVYQDGKFESATHATEALRLQLLDRWTAEGHPTTLDIGRLAFRRSEARQAVTLEPMRAAGLLGDSRWFHSLDKGYGGRAVHDTDGTTTALAGWFTRTRLDPAIVHARLALRLRWVAGDEERALSALTAGDAVTAALEIRRALHSLIGYLVEHWGARDNSWGRLGTRLDVLAAGRGEEGLMRRVWALYGLDLERVPRLMELAPAGIRHRHHRSFEARRLVGEPVSRLQDARDVLLAFSTRELREAPPYPSWVGLDVEPQGVKQRVMALRQLLDGLGR